MLLDLGDERAPVDRDLHGVVDLGQLVREERVDDDALHFDHLADVLTVSLLRHSTPGQGFARRAAGQAHAWRRGGVYPSAARPRPTGPKVAPGSILPPHGRRGPVLRRRRKLATRASGGLVARRTRHRLSDALGELLELALAHLVLARLRRHRGDPGAELTVAQSRRETGD